MNAAEQKTCETIEQTLCKSRAVRKVEEKLYVVKQGSSYVMINVLPWEDNHAIVRCVAQVLQGVRMEPGLSLTLLKLNAALRFGAFAWEEEGSLLLFLHSILGGETLDSEELMETVRDVAVVADEWDDKIMNKYGGQRMQDLLEDAALVKLLDGNPDEIDWDL